ncbi:hypothetical protein QQS21_004351 [Conoideocrella luteorostrata]|uniref:Fe2OG dioxygenase domain-containing protein n=1 Tax=Conoideocrella luteorostrata TaxID=1105319 RepID=A0AAJ0FZX9_9HYPO|nr:hypothetical protein QQS21_004351 [Conoideocrella luteorostrata]
MSTIADIPIIDLSGPQAEVAEQLVDAAAQHGFIYVRNLGHDIPAASVDQAFALVGDFKEAFNFGEFVDHKAQQPIPPTIAADEAKFSAFADLCRALCLKILALLGKGLEVDTFFSSAHFQSQSGSGSILRFLRYPPPSPTAKGSNDIRAGAHSDYGSITLLFRLKGQAGLEILKKDNTWAPVPVLPPGTEDDDSPPILINIGDLLSYWTNGLFRSTVHRVVFPTGHGNGAEGVPGESNAQPRYSIAYFCHPMENASLEAVPSERVKNFVPQEGQKDANPYAERKVLTAGEHLFMRLKETYGTLYGDTKD